MKKLLWVLIILAIATFLLMDFREFGKAPSGDRLELIKKSPNFKDGKFDNLNFTPQFSEGYSGLKVMTDFIFRRVPRRNPSGVIPSVKTDLQKLPSEENILVWFGHSSYFMQIDGKRFLVDPVLSGNASPVKGMIKSFVGSDIYSVDDLPDIDYLLITHDHYDHLDYRTVVRLMPKVGQVICGLGVGSHLEYWGYDPAKIIEKDWFDSVLLEDGFALEITPTRHFSGRNIWRNNTLWVSFVLQTPSLKIYIGGDSGYDTHYAEIGEKFGPFDLAIIENGQYNQAWRYIHNFPEEALQAAKDLGANRLFPVHAGKFALGKHSWDDPFIRITEYSKSANFPLVTPMIGEPVNLDNIPESFKPWWEGIK